MSSEGCAFCGGGDRWIKTCRTSEGDRIRVCDPCYEIRKAELVIVPGDLIVSARCDVCWRYGHPRDFFSVLPGGRKDAYAGTCPKKPPPKTSLRFVLPLMGL